MSHISVESGSLTAEQRNELIKRLATAASEVINVPEQFLTVTIKEHADGESGNGEIDSQNQMQQRMIPDPDVLFPIIGCRTVTHVKPTITNSNIIVGDFTYFSDVDFERNVLHHYAFNGDRLILGKYCQIASGVTFIMNGANHQMNAVSTYPFYIMGWRQQPPSSDDLPLKGDTIIGNDVWIGQNATILPGVHIGDGAIIGMNSVVGCDIEPYTIVVGNPARVLRKRFDDDLIGLLLRLKWWDKPVDEVQQLIPLLCDSNLEYVKQELSKYI